MESKTNYTIVGLTVLILIVGLFAAGVWLSVGFDRKKYDMYTLYIDEAVSGLSDDSAVKYNGVKVGLVSKIELDQLDPQQVKILIKIEEGTPITVSTQATLINQGITGTTYLGLSASSSSPFPLQKTPGEPYPVIPFKHSFLSKLEKNIHEVSMGIKRVFDKENALAIKKSLANIESVTQIIAKSNDSLHQSLKDLPVLLQDLKTAVNKFSNMTGHMSTAGKQVSIAMQSGKNAADKLSQQTLPPMVILLHRLDLIAANLEKVSAQMRQNPAIIIRGTTPLKPGPGE
ncbi:MAG: MlaD family protein [Legionellales bacterium]|nr:MlaD family protein [Legionellales bacterium]